MKQKETNRYITLTIILNSTKQSLKFNIGIHTTIKEISNKLAGELCLDVFRTRISFQYGYTTNKLDESKTLSQLSITNPQESIYANVESLHTKQLGKVTLREKKPVLKQKYRVTDLDLVAFHPGQIQRYEVDGLTLEGVCVNPKCLNFQRDIVYPIGFGTFSVDRILKEIKCDLCPYKDMGVNPPVVMKEMQFKQCKWTISGKKQARVGNGYFEQSLNRWVRVEGKDNLSYQQIVGQDQWLNVWIEIKPISTQTQLHPYLMQPNCLEDYYYQYN
ncbi:hypothetical protein pb186bvf_013360 [Paramecium bursaria]